MNKRENRTTIQIEKKTLDLLRSQLEYKERNEKHFIETYDDLLKRLIKEYKENNI
jgi:hypothetical protein